MQIIHAIAAWLVALCGLACLVVFAVWLLFAATDRVVHLCKTYRIIAEYAWHWKEFRRWLKEHPRRG